MIDDDEITVERPREDAMSLVDWLIGTELIAIVVFALLLIVRSC